MKNKDYIQSINRIEPDQAARERMLRQILDRAESRPATIRKVNTMNKTLHWKRLVPIAACLAVVVAAVLVLPALKNNGGLIDDPKTQTTIDAAPAPNIVINEVPKISADRLNLALFGDDFVSMSKQEIIDYYGFDFFPKSIPSDMTEAPETAFGLYKRNGGTGEVYHSANLAWYINADFSRELQVEIDKGQLPLTDVAFLGGEHEKSNINGVDMVIKRWVDSAGEVRFVAEMMFRGNGLRVSSRGFTQAEFIDTVSSLLG